MLPLQNSTFSLLNTRNTSFKNIYHKNCQFVNWCIWGAVFFFKSPLFNGRPSGEFICKLQLIVNLITYSNVRDVLTRSAYLFCVCGTSATERQSAWSCLRLMVIAATPDEMKACIKRTVTMELRFGFVLLHWIQSLSVRPSVRVRVWTFSKITLKVQWRLWWPDNNQHHLIACDQKLADSQLSPVSSTRVDGPS